MSILFENRNFVWHSEKIDGLRPWWYRLGLQNYFKIIKNSWNERSCYDCRNESEISLTGKETIAITQRVHSFKWNMASDLITEIDTLNGETKQAKWALDYQVRTAEAHNGDVRFTNEWQVITLGKTCEWAQLFPCKNLPSTFISVGILINAYHLNMLYRLWKLKPRFALFIKIIVHVSSDNFSLAS